jgi:hypothetical protein
VVAAYLILIPVSLLISSGILYIVGKMLLKYFQGSYADTLSGLVYGETSALTFVWIPVLGWIAAAIGGIVVSLVAIANLNKTTWVKVLIAFIVEYIVIFILEWILHAL